MPAPKKSSAPRASSLSATYSRIIPLMLDHAYINTPDARSVHVKVGSEVFYNLLAAYVGTPVAPGTAKQCTALAEANPSASVHWLAAAKLLSVDEDNNPLITLEALLAEFFPKEDVVESDAVTA